MKKAALFLTECKGKIFERAAAAEGTGDLPAEVGTADRHILPARAFEPILLLCDGKRLFDGGKDIHAHAIFVPYAEGLFHIFGALYAVNDFFRSPVKEDLRSVDDGLELY